MRNPERLETQIFRAGGSVSIVGADGALVGEDVLPGFWVRLSDVVR